MRTIAVGPLRSLHLEHKRPVVFEFTRPVYRPSERLALFKKTSKPNFRNRTLLSFSKWLVNYPAQNSLETTDFNRPMVAMLRKAEELSPEDAPKILPDRVHPSFAGHLVMADQLMKAWERGRLSRRL